MLAPTRGPVSPWSCRPRARDLTGSDRLHEIPVRDGVALQGDDELGEALSAGCVRQSTDDAAWMWDWAGTGTTVVVLP